MKEGPTKKITKANKIWFYKQEGFSGWVIFGVLNDGEKLY